jgi:mRNA interferase MazF
MPKAAFHYSLHQMPRQGDIIKVNFDPQSGHEQKGWRPALVISRDLFNNITSTIIVCPVTSADRGFDLHVRLDERTKTKGVVLCDHVKSIDSLARGVIYIESCPSDILENVVDIVTGIIETD